MIDLKLACKKALNEMPGYQIVSACEIADGWIFSFRAFSGAELDISPLFVSRETGESQFYSFEEHIIEILNASPIELVDL